MLDATLSAQLSQHLTNVKHPIELVASLDESKKSTDLDELLHEIAALSDLITVRTNVDRRSRSSARGPTSTSASPGFPSATSSPRSSSHSSTSAAMPPD